MEPEALRRVLRGSTSVHFYSQRRGSVERVTPAGLSRHDNLAVGLRRVVSDMLEPISHNVLGCRARHLPARSPTHLSM
jgi:hypothetical protein